MFIVIKRLQKIVNKLSKYNFYVHTILIFGVVCIKTKFIISKF